MEGLGWVGVGVGAAITHAAHDKGVNTGGVVEGRGRVWGGTMLRQWWHVW